MDDSLIVDLFLNRDQAAIVEVKSKYGKPIRKIIKNIVDNNETTEECENDTYFAGWNSIPPNEPRDYLFAYLGKIARRIAIDHIRREKCEKRNGRITDISDELEKMIPSNCDVEKIVEDKQFLSALYDCIKGLKKYKRIIFIRRYFYMDTIDELAKQTGYSTSKIKSILFRTRKEVKNILKEKYGWE